VEQEALVAMPKVRRHNLPPALFQHLLNSVQKREIPASQLELLARWLDKEPDVPDGEWYKRLPGMIVCGEGKLIKTFLVPGQLPRGKSI
jgi:hypothetical protein